MLVTFGAFDLEKCFEVFIKQKTADQLLSDVASTVSQSVIKFPAC